MENIPEKIISNEIHLVTQLQIWLMLSLVKIGEDEVNSGVIENLVFFRYFFKEVSYSTYVAIHFLR